MNIDEARKKIDEIFGEFAFKLSRLNYKNIADEEEFIKNLKDITNIYLAQAISISRQVSISEPEDGDYFFITELRRKIGLAVPADFPRLFAIFAAKKGVTFGWVEKKGQFANIASNALLVIKLPEISDIKKFQDGKMQIFFDPPDSLIN